MQMSHIAFSGSAGKLEQEVLNFSYLLELESTATHLNDTSNILMCTIVKLATIV